MKNYSPTHPISKRVEADIGVFFKCVCCRTVQPSSAVLQGLGKIPVVQRYHGNDVGLEKKVDEFVVVVYTGFVGSGAGSMWENPCPSDGKSVIGYLSGEGITALTL